MEHHLEAEKTNELLAIGRVAWRFKIAAWGLTALAIILAALLGLQLLWLMLAGFICSAYGFATSKLRGVKAMTSTTLFDFNLVGYEVQRDKIKGWTRIAVKHGSGLTTWIEVKTNQVRYILCILQTCGIHPAG